MIGAGKMSGFLDSNSHPDTTHDNPLQSGDFGHVNNIALRVRPVSIPNQCSNCLFYSFTFVDVPCQFGIIQCVSFTS